jgi:hypothetical protein
MTSPALLDDIRGFYLEHFRRVVKEKRRVPAARILTETTLRNKNGMAFRKGALKLPFRKDLVIRSLTVNGSFEIKTEKTLQFEPMTLTWRQGLTVIIGPFRWEECPVKILGAAPENKSMPLADWYDRWFDEFDTKGPLKKEFQEVVHYLEAIEQKDGLTKLTIDLGSAPKSAFEELLDALEQGGCSIVEIGQVDQVAD